VSTRTPSRLERLRGRRRQEAARDDHVGIEREHFLDRAAGVAEALRKRGRHRARARIVAVVRHRQDLRRIGDFGENGVGARVEADYRGEFAFPIRRNSTRTTCYRHHRGSGDSASEHGAKPAGPPLSRG
jgi:hypothetical protein